MGFLDSIFGLSNSNNTQNAVQQGISGIGQGVADANRVLGNTTRSAADAFRTGTQNASDALMAGYGQARGDMLNYGQQAQGQLAAGRDSALSTILGSNANYQPFLGAGQTATSMLQNALGLNGAGGHDAAESAFRAGPGYEFARDQAVDATSRKMAALGMAGSGNTLDAITKQASGLADQEYGSWLDRLSGLGTQGLTAAGGIANNNQAAGNVQFNAGNLGAQLSQNLGTSLGGLGTGLGGALAGLQSNLGNALGGLQQSLGQQKAGNLMGGASTTANLGVLGGQAADTADNANNSAISKLLGGVIGLPMGGLTGGYGSNTGGFSITPGANGALSISPSAATNSGHGLLGMLGVKL